MDVLTLPLTVVGDVVSTILTAPISPSTVAVALVVAYVVHLSGVLQPDKLKRYNIPGPPTKPFIGTDLNHDDVALSLYEYSKQYGSHFQVTFGTDPHVVILNPKDLRKVFVTEWDKLDRGKKMYAADTAGAAMGHHSLEVVQNEEWVPLRNAMNKVFQGNWLEKSTRVMNEKASDFNKKLLEDTRGGKPSDIVPMMQNVSLDILTVFMFTKDWHSLEAGGSRLMESVQYSMNHIIHRNTMPIPYWRWIKTAAVKEFDARMEEMSSMADDVITEREANGFVPDGDEDVDLVWLMYEAVKRGELTMEQLRDNTRMMFNAADTTPAGMSWMLYYLARYPQVQDKVRQEIKDVMGADKFITYDKLKEMKYLNNVMRETLRMKPPVRAFQSRYVKDDIEFSTFTVPKGVHIALCTYATHMSEEIWGSDAHEFNPDRFLPENSKGRDAMGFIPFLHGKRNCWGQRFAELEVKILLARLVQDVQLHLHEKEEPAGIKSFVYHPVHVNVTATPVSQ